MTYFLPTVQIEETKFITYDDRAVCIYAVRSADAKPHAVDIEVLASYPPMPHATAEAAYPLLGRGVLQDMPLYLYLDAPRIRPATWIRDSPATDDQRAGGAAAATATAGAAQAQVAVSFENAPRTGASTPLPDDLLERASAGSPIGGSPTTCPTSTPPTRHSRRCGTTAGGSCASTWSQANTADLQGHRFLRGQARLRQRHRLRRAGANEGADLPARSGVRARSGDQQLSQPSSRRRGRRPTGQPVLGRDLLALDRRRARRVPSRPPDPGPTRCGTSCRRWRPTCGPG